MRLHGSKTEIPFRQWFIIRKRKILLAIDEEPCCSIVNDELNKVGFVGLKQMSFALQIE